MGKLFGTDGLRGVAGEYPLDAATTELLGHLLYFLLEEKGIERELIIGRDTRESGPSIFSSICRGFSRAGGKIDDAGVLSTPALAFLAKTNKKCSISITASHNAYLDNGIKIFGPDGYKVSEELEDEIEPYLLGEKTFGRNLPGGECQKNQELQEHFRSEYAHYLIRDLFRDLDLHGITVAVDCANGALSNIAPPILRELGAAVHPVHDQPNGRNINDHCGSLYPQVLFEELRRNGADCGFTFDGDGDRCLAADRSGMYDGDYLLAAAARYLKSRGELKRNTVVATSMSNFGLEVFLNQHGIEMLRVPVGDKNVLEKLQQEDLSLGGEQSGHIIFMNDTFIGDGLLTALQMLRIHKNAGAPFISLCDGFKKFPQLLVNIPVRRKPELTSITDLQSKIDEFQSTLGNSGRILVRYSGTEQLARVMVEGPDESQVQRMANELAEIVRTRLN
jgi:phosphoglucosamine mutase